MSGPNAHLSQPPERDLLDAPPAPVIPPDASIFPPAADLALTRIAMCIAAGERAMDAMRAARASGDIAANEAAAVQLVAAFQPDPKALSRHVKDLASRALAASRRSDQSRSAKE